MNVTEVEKETLVDIEQPESPVTSIEKLINKLPPRSLECSIYRVPAIIRDQNEKLYTPQVVAIGPFHHGVPKLQAMEENKLRYLKALLLHSTLTLEDCKNVIINFESQIRNSYSQSFDLTPDQFMRIVLVDSCFVIEAILAYSDLRFDETSSVSGIHLRFDADLMLIENQIPFNVLDAIFQLGFPNEPRTKFLECCIYYFFNRLLNQVDIDRVITKVKDYLATSDHIILHFVDLLRLCHLPSKLRSSTSDVDTHLLTTPKITEIQDAGIILKKGSSISALDIQYTRGVLEIPQVILVEGAECMLSNILVLETCHYINDSYIRDYIFFMDMLIDTPKDVDLLIQKGIITTWMGDSSSVSSLFNKIGYNFFIIGSNYYFYGMSQDLTAYCKLPRHRYKAAFKRDYCSTPWMIASTTAAIILLVFTFIQTICSIIQTVRTT